MSECYECLVSGLNKGSGIASPMNLLFHLLPPVLLISSIPKLKLTQTTSRSGKVKLFLRIYEAYYVGWSFGINTSASVSGPILKACWRAY